MSRLGELHSLVISPQHHLSQGIFNTIAKLSQEGDHLCTMTQSPHQLMYNLYNIIALTEIKGYAMLQFSYMMLKIYNKGNFTAEAEAAKAKFEEQATEKMNSIKMVLPTMSRQYRKCDPAEHRKGETYLEV